MPFEQSHEKFARYEREDESARRDEQRIEAAKKEHWIRDAEAKACAKIAADLFNSGDYESEYIAVAIVAAIEGRIEARAKA